VEKTLHGSDPRSPRWRRGTSSIGRSRLGSTFTARDLYLTVLRHDNRKRQPERLPRAPRQLTARPCPSRRKSDDGARARIGARGPRPGEREKVWGSRVSAISHVFACRTTGTLNQRAAAGFASLAGRRSRGVGALGGRVRGDASLRKHDIASQAANRKWSRRGERRLTKPCVMPAPPPQPVRAAGRRPVRAGGLVSSVRGQAEWRKQTKPSLRCTRPRLGMI
jgi:hypothetical protein